ncbi:MAG: hypothetical protein ABJ327_16280 [Litoreibacter sp.]
MSTYMSQDVLQSLQKADLKKAKSKSRMRVRTGDAIFPILRFSKDRFSLSVDEAPKLRGYVDILDGARLKWRALIIASEQENDEIIFEFKRSTTVAKGPALDFEKDTKAPVGYLESF